MSKAYDPTEDMNPEETVRWYIDRAKWGQDRDERGLISLRSYEEAQKTLRGLLTAMREDDKFHLDAVQAVQTLRAYLKSYRIQEGISKKVVDGDGDGWVYDGTPRKRPATPAEMEAGRKLRARQGRPAAGKGPAAKKGAKKAPAKKSPYQQRVDKFVRAVNQAKKSGNAQDKKRVRDLIRQDLILKPKERHDLTAMLDDRGPAPAKKAPAKAPAKRAAAKAPAKKPEAKPDTKGKPVPGKPGVKDGGYDKDGYKQPDSDGVVRLSRPGDKARVGNQKPGAIREAAKKPIQPDPPSHKSNRPAAKKPAPKVPSAGEGGSAERRRALIEGMKGAIKRINDPAEVNAQKAKISRAYADGKLSESAYNEIQGALEQRAQSLRPKKTGVNTRIERMKQKIGLGTTPHGKKTQAWQRLWNRDLGRARTLKDFQRLQAQVRSLQQQGRISDREASKMTADLKQKAIERGVVRAKTPNPFNNPIKQPSARRPTPVGNGHETKAYEAIAAAKDDAALDRAVESVKRAFEGGHINRERYNGVLAEAVRQRKRLRPVSAKKPAPTPPAKKQVARQVRPTVPDAKGTGTGHTSAIRAAKNVSEADKVIDAIEADPNLSDDEFNRYVAMIHAKKMILKKDPEFVAAKKAFGGNDTALVKAVNQLWSEEQADALLAVLMDKANDDRESESYADSVADALNKVQSKKAQVAADNRNLAGYPSHSDAPEDNNVVALAALTKHFDGGGDIETAPTAGLWNYIQTNPDRFEIKAKGGAAGITPKYTIHDKKNGRRYWVKGDMTKYGAVPNGAVREAFAMQAMQAFGLRPPQAVVGQHGAVYDDNDDAPGKFFIQGDYGKITDRAYNAQHVAEIGRGKEPEGLMNLLVLDYLFDNRDRHGGNMMVYDTPSGGKQVAYLDLGLGFGGFRDSYGYETFEQWYARSGRNREWDHLTKAKMAYAMQGGDVQEKFKEIAGRLQNLDWDSIRAAMIRQGMDKRDVDEWIQVAKRRAGNLSSGSALLHFQ